MKVLVFCLFIFLMLTFFGCGDAGEQKYKNQLESILSVKDISNEKNIPKFEEYLKSNDGSIHKYAAAQALFLMDSPKARNALEKHMFSSPKYYLFQSINYMFHWGMKPVAKRNEFIKKYHLRSSSKLIPLSVESSYPDNYKNKINFKLILKNRTASPIRLYKPRFYLGQYILIMSSSGEFAKPVSTTMYKLRRYLPEECYIELLPQKSYVFNFSGELKTFPDSPGTEFRDGLWLDCGDFAHKISYGGLFKIYGIYSHKVNTHFYNNIWTGRVVSEPIDVILKR